MGTITIVGLGPGGERCLTREAWRTLKSAGEIWLRTAQHPAVEALPAHLTLHAFDDIYENAEDFQQVYDTISQRIVTLGKRFAGVIYGVPGHPLVGESTVNRILEMAREEALNVRLVEGLSFLGPTLSALRIDALDGLQIHDALALVACHHPPLNPDYPALLGQLYSEVLAADVKLVLMNQYPDDHPVTLVRAAGTTDQQVTPLPLYAIDRRNETGGLNHLTTLYVPPLPGVTSFEGFQETIARLRAPDGCPWDREQTHQSLRRNLLEEAYEVIAAIDDEDLASLQEELGDLLLQITLQTQIATEDEAFKMKDVIAGIDAKLKRRHPHVWGDREVGGASEVSQRWEQLKKAERGDGRSALEGVPRIMPALQQADTYSQRAARVGFDWRCADGVAEKVREEITEIEEAATQEEREAELGDLLFAVVNWARWLGVEAETALRKANARFARRFYTMERLVSERGVDMTALSMDVLEALWQDAKREEDPA